MLASNTAQCRVSKCKDENGKSIYSETACSGKESEVVKLEKVPPPPDKNEATQRCYKLHETFLRYTYKDPESIRLERSSVEWVSVVGLGARQKITVMINGKNSYGAYEGSKPFSCLWMPDGRVLNVSGFEIR